jgi:hypothetical protein
MARHLTVAATALILGFAAFSAVPAQAKEQLLGAAVYEAKAQRDVVDVGAKEGAFKAIRFEVKGSDVEVLDLKVVYGNGNADDIQVRKIFKAGSSSRTLDLAGRQRAIKQIIVTYRAKGPARIQFFGIEGAAPASWERLGCQSVGFFVDRDVIKVGRKEGTFSAIRLKVRQAPIEIFDLKVVFGNGRSQDIRVRALIPAGSESRPIDLIGKERGIDRVQMIYRSIPTFKGKAEVCVDGLQK